MAVAIALMALSGMFLPIANHEKAYHHAANVGQMGHVVARHKQGLQQFYRGIATHKIFGFDGKGKGNDEHALVGKEHSET